MARSDKRFIRVYTDSRFSGSNEIWVDTQTGVNYLFHYFGDAGGMTVLLDETGKPVVTPRYEVENLIYENR